MKTIDLADRRTPAPAASGKWWRIEDVLDDTVDVYIFDQIGLDWWTGDGITSKQFAAQLAAITAGTINVHINSVGGDAWQGIAIYNLLVEHPATIHVIVDGIAASIASVIAMAGDTVTMRLGSQVMIHDPWTVVSGDASDLTKTIEELNSTADSVAAIYAERAGGSVDDWRDLMRAETWYTADEAVEAGLADEVAGIAGTSTVEDESRLAIFAYAGRRNAPPPGLRKPAQGSIHHQSIPTDKEVGMSDLKAAMAAALGLDADSTDEQIVAAVDALKAPRDEMPAITVPDGAVLVDQGVLDELKEKAEAGVAAQATLNAQRRDALISKAEAEGRITAASAKVWRDRMNADEAGVTALLDTLPTNVVPVAEIGHSDKVGDQIEARRDDLRAKMTGGATNE